MDGWRGRTPSPIMCLWLRRFMPLKVVVSYFRKILRILSRNLLNFTVKTGVVSHLYSYKWKNICIIVKR